MANSSLNVTQPLHTAETFVRLIDNGDSTYSIATAGGSSDAPTYIQQSVTADSNNSSTTNLASGNSYTFTGTATSTLGVAGIQVSLFADKNCMVYVDQSPNGTNWDIVDDYIYLASCTNFGFTVQAINSYVRVRVTTNAETTTAFRLLTALCPIVEAVPRSLDENGNFGSPTQ